MGVDILPRKTCNLNCIYCELGPTKQHSTDIKAYIPVEEIWADVKKLLENPDKKFDYLTFTASGEPTLHSGIGELINRAKALTSTPITVLTNGTTLSLPEVRKRILSADILLPSLDAARQTTFQKINRPAPGLIIDDIIEGLAELRKEFSGKIWLEVLIAKDINDSPEDIDALKDAITYIKPDKVQLNTVARPPADTIAHALSQARLNEIAKFLGPSAEVIVNFSKKIQQGSHPIIDAEILDVLQRRPSTIEDLAQALGIKTSQVEKALQRLQERGVITPCPHNSIPFYCLTDEQ